MNQPYLPHLPLPAALVKELGQRFGKRFSTSQAVRDQHGRDESVHPAAAPDAVVFAESTDDVAEAVRLCHTYRVPILSLIHI